MEDTYILNGKKYKIIEMIDLKDDENIAAEKLPLIDIKLISDIEWEYKCLISRIHHPEYYSTVEDVESSVNRITEYLKDRQNEADTGNFNIF